MKKKGDLLASLLGILLGLAVVIASTRLRLGTPTEPQPGFFPFIAGATLFVLCGILFLKALAGRSPGTEPFGALWRPGILTVGLFLYALVLDFMGYVPATIVLSVVVLWVLETKNWWKLAGISLVLAISTYVLFDRVLGVSLPDGLLAVLR